MLTVEEVANYLSTTIRTVRELIKTQKLRAVRVGREYRVMRTDLEKFVEQNIVR